jgi:hypothetical protein
MLRITPDRRSSIRRSASRLHKNVPYTWTRSIRSNSASPSVLVARSDSTGPPAIAAWMLASTRWVTSGLIRAIPALFTRTSSGPRSVSTARKAAATADSSLTSHG